MLKSFFVPDVFSSEGSINDKSTRFQQNQQPGSIFWPSARIQIWRILGPSRPPNLRFWISPRGRFECLFVILAAGIRIPHWFWSLSTVQTVWNRLWAQISIWAEWVGGPPAFLTPTFWLQTKSGAIWRGLMDRTIYFRKLTTYPCYEQVYPVRFSLPIGRFFQRAEKKRSKLVKNTWFWLVQTLLTHFSRVTFQDLLRLNLNLLIHPYDCPLSYKHRPQTLCNRSRFFSSDHTGFPDSTSVIYNGIPL